MDQTRARELQEKLALEAAAMLSLAGSGAETAPYEQAVSLIGKAWRLTAEETSEQLALIEQEKAVMGRIENGESAEHIRQELLLNWSGLESIEVLEGLFETSTLLETAPERRSLFDMAMLLIETQNLLDWIEYKLIINPISCREFPPSCRSPLYRWIPRCWPLCRPVCPFPGLGGIRTLRPSSDDLWRLCAGRSRNRRLSSCIDGFSLSPLAQVNRGVENSAG